MRAIEINARVSIEINVAVRFLVKYAKIARRHVCLNDIAFAFEFVLDAMSLCLGVRGETIDDFVDVDGVVHPQVVIGLFSLLATLVSLAIDLVLLDIYRDVIA